jgi:hypothetical protein
MKVTRALYNNLDPEIKETLRNNSLFASESFCNLFKTINGNPVCYLLEKDNQPVVALTGVEFGRGIFKRFQSMPDGCYSSLIPLDEKILPDENDARAILNAINRAGYIKSYIFDYHAHFPSNINYIITNCNTQQVTVSPEWQPPDKKLLSEIRKAQNEGVEITPYDKVKHAGQFFALAKSTAHRHSKTMRYPEEFYNSLADIASEDNRVSWSIVLHDGLLATSHINFRIGETLLNWQVHFDKQFSFLKPNQFLLYHAAIQAANDGATILNLGSSPPDADSLEVYKRKWGGCDYNYGCIEMKSLLGKLF